MLTHRLTLFFSFATRYFRGLVNGSEGFIYLIVLNILLFIKRTVWIPVDSVACYIVEIGAVPVFELSIRLIWLWWNGWPVRDEKPAAVSVFATIRRESPSPCSSRARRATLSSSSLM